MYRLKLTKEVVYKMIKKMRNIKKAEEILLKDYRTKEVTEDSIEQTKKYPHLFRGSVKTSLGRFYTSLEFNRRKEKILKAKLP